MNKKKTTTNVQRPSNSVLKMRTLVKLAFSGHVNHPLTLSFVFINFIFKKLDNLAPVEMTPRGERRHYLSKSCATSDQCQKRKISASS